MDKLLNELKDIPENFTNVALISSLLSDNLTAVVTEFKTQIASSYRELKETVDNLSADLLTLENHESFITSTKILDLLILAKENNCNTIESAITSFNNDKTKVYFSKFFENLLNFYTTKNPELNDAIDAYLNQDDEDKTSTIDNIIYQLNLEYLDSILAENDITLLKKLPIDALEALKKITPAHYEDAINNLIITLNQEQKDWEESKEFIDLKATLDQKPEATKEESLHILANDDSDGPIRKKTKTSDTTIQDFVTMSPEPQDDSDMEVAGEV